LGIFHANLLDFLPPGGWQKDKFGFLDGEFNSLGDKTWWIFEFSQNCGTFFKILTEGKN
jgi:hypothetical protein